MMLVTVLVSLAGMIPTWAVRRFLNWRILRSADEYRPAEVQFRISQAMVWTTFFAVILVMGRIVAHHFEEQDSGRFLLVILGSVMLPTIPMLVVLVLVSRLRGFKLLAAMPVLGLVTTSAYLFAGVFLLQLPTPDMLPFFIQTTAWFAVAGWLVVFC